MRAKTVRALQRRPAELVRLLKTAHNVDMMSDGGIYLGTATALRLDSHVHDTMVTRIVQGLYAHHFGTALAPSVPVCNDILDIDKKGLQELLAPMLQTMHVHQIGGSAFEYAYTRLDQQPDSSVWLLDFYH